MVDKVGGVEFDVTIDSTGAVAGGMRVIGSNQKLKDSFAKVDDATKKTESAFSSLGVNANQLEAAFSKSNNTLRSAIARQISLGNTITKNNTVIDKNGDELVDATAALKKYTNQVSALGEKIEKVDQAHIGFARSSKGASKAIGGMGRNVGMAGVQIGQFAGQIQGGQSALLAFSQQGADIGMLFGPAGMIAGGIVAVGAALAGALVPGLMDSTDATKNLADKLRELQKENKLTEAQTKFLADQEVIANKIKEDRIKEIKEEIKETETLIKRINSQADSLGRMGKAAQIRIDSGEIEVAESRVTELNAEMDELQGKTGGDTDAVALAARRS